MAPPFEGIRRSARRRLPPQPARYILPAGLGEEQPPRSRPKGIPGNLLQDPGRPPAQLEEQPLVIFPCEPGEDPPR
jgi:hypothetical protein